METNAFLWDFWYFHIPNYIVSIIIYTLMGRFLLGIFVPPNAPNYIMRFFCRITDPVLRATDWIIPGYVSPRMKPLAAAFHLYLLRVVVFIVLYAQGLTPRLAAPGG